MVTSCEMLLDGYMMLLVISSKTTFNNEHLWMILPTCYNMFFQVALFYTSLSHFNFTGQSLGSTSTIACCCKFYTIYTFSLICLTNFYYPFIEPNTVKPFWLTVLHLLLRRFINLGPDEAKDICLLRLSPGGSDAEVIREFNVTG